MYLRGQEQLGHNKKNSSLPVRIYLEQHFGWDLDLEGDNLVVGAPGQEVNAFGIGICVIHKIWNILVATGENRPPRTDYRPFSFE